MLKVGGTKGSLPFTINVRTEKRGRNRWTVTVQDDNSSLELSCLPPLDEDLFSLLSISGEDGEPLCKPEEEEVIIKEDKPEEPSSTSTLCPVTKQGPKPVPEVRLAKSTSCPVPEQCLKPVDDVPREEESTRRDRLGNEAFQTEGFWRKQGITPTWPSFNAGEWRQRLLATTERTEEALSKFVQRGMARTTRQAHRRGIKWIKGLPIPAKDATISQWLLMEYEKQAAERCWRGSTLATKLATTQGALAHPPSTATPSPPYS